MPAEVMEQWLQSSKPALISGREVRPREHPVLKGAPVSTQRGQAEAFYLVGADGAEWIVKKFLPARLPDRAYLEAIRSVLPQGEAFRCGTEREVLSPAALANGRGRFYSAELASWMDGTVLMPRIGGADWATLADALREGRCRLESDQRLALCRGLSQVVEELEARRCSHRDFSAGNVFVSLGALAVSLIDWDSTFHPTLPMPQNTTCGTAGYIAPFAWNGGQVDLRRTWHPLADRFGLAVLCAEFLLLSAGSPLTAEGGMFRQDELRRRGGSSISSFLAALRRQFPGAEDLLRGAVQAPGYEGCPSPGQWRQFSERLLPPEFEPPALGDIEEVERAYFAEVLGRRRPPAPVWPAPGLEELPAAAPLLPAQTEQAPSLPDDPWKS